MPETKYRNRRAVSIESSDLRVTVTVEGGHVAEIADKDSGMNPLWTPPWPSIEPSTYDPAKHPEYGLNSESKLLAGIMGHNLCLDIFGAPSEDEAAAGLTVHGEASVAPYTITTGQGELTARCELPLAGLRFERHILVSGRRVLFRESVENLRAFDRPIAWTQHVTLGPPFLEKGATEFRVSATRAKVTDTDFSDGKGYMKIGAEFEWPFVPGVNGGSVNLNTFTNTKVSAGYTAQLMDPKREQAYFLAYTPSAKLMFGYVWKRTDFPWLGIWEENYCRTLGPWNGKTLTRGMEFGVSPFPESRRAMIERGSLFGVPGYRWIPAKSTLRAEYAALLMPASQIAEQPPF